MLVPESIPSPCHIHLTTVVRSITDTSRKPIACNPSIASPLRERQSTGCTAHPFTCRCLSDRCRRAGTRIGRHGMEQHRELACPGSDRCPIPHVARRHMVKREVELRRVDNTAKQLDCYRREPGSRRECLVELRTCTLPLLLGEAERAERENRDWQTRERRAMAHQEPARVFMPAAHIQGRSKHDGVVAVKSAYLPCGLHLHSQPRFAEYHSNDLGDLPR